MTKPATVVELKIPSSFGYEDFAMVLVESLAKKMGFPQKKISNLKIAVGEGLVGQVALEQKTFSIIQKLEECPPVIRSGLANV